MLLTPTAAQGDDHAPPSVVRLSRRQLLWGAAGLAGMPLACDADASRRVTADDAKGPFYPASWPADDDFDLSHIAGHPARAQGQLLYVGGRVVNPRGEPVPNALLVVWQANAAGRYAHPGDTSSAPLDPHFHGVARVRTGPDGSYGIKTIQPGPYHPRTRHIHFDVQGRSSRLVTQMYFEGEAMNERDPLLARRSPEERRTLIARPGTPGARQERDAMVVTWDIVLALG